jgi:hypothetical protein
LGDKVNLLKTLRNLAAGQPESQEYARPESVFSDSRGCPNKKDRGEDGPRRDRETYYPGPVSTPGHKQKSSSTLLEVALRGRYDPYYGYADYPKLRRLKENQPQTVALVTHFGVAL